jgi:hypothetical protein
MDIAAVNRCTAQYLMYFRKLVKVWVIVAPSAGLGACHAAKKTSQTFLDIIQSQAWL